MSRIALLEREQLPDDLRPLYDAFVEKRGVVPNMIKTVAHAPDLVRGFAAFMGPLMGAGEVSHQLKELIALYISLRNQCEY